MKGSCGPFLALRGILNNGFPTIVPRRLSLGPYCGRYGSLTMFTKASRSFPPFTTTPKTKPIPRA
jgi:hypothetical protein